MQKIQLSIPQPCHQNWDAMTPTEQGRFCNACAKQVIDFSTMSDAQVLNYFNNIKNENVCGRAYPDQLERAITLPKEIKKKKFWYWNYITMLFLFFSKTNNSKAQTGDTLITTVPRDWGKEKINNGLMGRVGGIWISKKNSITGKVTDKDGEAVAGASVIIKGAAVGTSTNSNGDYNIEADAKNDNIVISAVGFEPKEIKLSTIHDYDFVLTKLERQTLGEVVVGGVFSVDEYYSSPQPPKHIAILEVKDNASLQPIKNASIIIKKENTNKIDSAYTDSKGMYKIKKIKEDESYIVKIVADGFLPTEIKINGHNFDSRREAKQIFLEKLPAAADYKKLDSVVVNAYPLTGKLTTCTAASSITMGAMISSQTITNRSIKDSILLIKTKIFGTIKTYPDPIAKGNSFNVALKLNETGAYNIQVIAANGSIVLQKQINAMVKETSEQIPTDKRWSSGIYYIRVFDAQNKFVSTNSFMVY